MPPEHQCTWVYVGSVPWERKAGDPECPAGSTCSSPTVHGDYMYEERTTGCSVD